MGAEPSSAAPHRAARRRTLPGLADVPRAGVAGVRGNFGAGLVALDAGLRPSLARGLEFATHGAPPVLDRRASSFRADDDFYQCLGRESFAILGRNGSRPALSTSGTGHKVPRSRRRSDIVEPSSNSAGGQDDHHVAGAV